MQRRALREQMQAFDQQMRVVLAQKGVAVGDSADALGEVLMGMASHGEQLVVVTVASRRAAEGLLHRAGGAVGRRVRQALQPGSRLSEEEGEEGVQHLFSKLVEAQPPGRLRVHDVHDRSSVCRGFKPDTVVTRGPHLLPNSTVLLVDLKRQDGGYNSPAHIQQVRGASCCMQLYS